VKKVVVLVTGVGTPRNWTHSVSGNSTMAAGKLMSMFVEENKEGWGVERVHGEGNIFR
jgi:hypothetical protein